MRKKRQGCDRSTPGGEEIAITLLRHAAMGERLTEVVYASLLETKTGRELWVVVRALCGALGLPGVCLMLDKRLYEVGKRGGEEKVIGMRVPGGRMVVRLEEETRRASLAMMWVVRRALEHGAGTER